jgi:hypothetical protein
MIENFYICFEMIDDYNEYRIRALWRIEGNIISDYNKKPSRCTRWPFCIT